MTSQINKISNWITSIENIRGEINLLNKVSSMFLEIAKKFNEKKITPELWKFIKALYSSDISMRIRRLIDEDKRTESLSGLINEILFNYTIISRDWFLNKYPDGNNESLFKDLFIENTLNTSLLINDLNYLKKESEIMRIFTDKVIAHKDKSKPKNIPNFNEVHKLIKVITDLFDRYYYLLKQSHWSYKN